MLYSVSQSPWVFGDSVRAVLGLDSAFVIDGEFDSLPCQSFNDLLHCIKLRYISIRDNADSVDTHVLEIHADLLSAAGAESNGAGRHFERIFFLSRMIDGRREPLTSFSKQGGCMVMAWV